MNETKPIISVCITAYNNQPYITKCIDSILNQATSYPFEILVFDDRSTDETPEIVRRYAEKHIGKIKLIERTENLGASRNISHSIFECKGKYIARCDGDDYWNDTGKLQKQIDFLEANPDFVICHHRSIIITPGSNIPERLSLEQKEVAGFEDFFNGNFILSNTCVLRNNYMPYPNWLNRLSIEDWSIYLLYTKDGGKVKYFNEPMATHLKHGTGVYHSMENLKRDLSVLSSVLITKKSFDKTYTSLFNTRLAILYYNIIKEYKWSKDYINIIKYTVKLYSIRKKHNPPLTFMQLLKNIVA